MGKVNLLLSNPYICVILYLILGNYLLGYYICWSTLNKKQQVITQQEKNEQRSIAHKQVENDIIEIIGLLNDRKTSK